MTPGAVLLALFSILPIFVQAQLSGDVGPLTSFASKAKTKTCNVLDYGAVADGETDFGPALQSAWQDCKVGGLVYIPPGNFALASWQNIRSGTASGIQLDGTIIRTGTDGGTLLSIRGCHDFELFSGNSKGAIQGYGYEYISQGELGPRFIRLQDMQDFSVHGIALVDSPSYYMVFDNVRNGEIYNLILRGISNIGETDGIDLAGNNVWVHDVEVTNGDECVTVKSPSENLLIESIYCNLSGGTAIGSLGGNTVVENVSYRNLYMNRADACYIKTNGGSGAVSGVVWDTVIVQGGPYVLAVNEAWGEDRGAEGVQVSNLTFKNWHGYNSDPSRPAIRMDCDPDVPCYDISITDVHLWTADGDYVTWDCSNAYGTGACLREDTGDLTTYRSVSTITATPTYSASTMPSDHASGFPSTKSFTIPPIPTTFFPGQKPSSVLLKLSAAGGLKARNEPSVPTSAP